MGGRLEMGASFGIYGLKGYGLDIAMPRRERATGRGHRDFQVSVDPFLGTEQAARRRDFTVNALMENVLTGQVLDHFHGLDDLRRGILRHVDSRTFPEDPLRVLRGAQVTVLPRSWVRAASIKAKGRRARLRRAAAWSSTSMVWFHTSPS